MYVLVCFVHMYIRIPLKPSFVPPSTKWKLWGKIQYCYKNWKEDSIKKSKRGSFLQPKQTSRELSSRLLWLWKTVEKTCSNLSNYSWWIIAATTYCSDSSLEFAAIFCKNPLSLCASILEASLWNELHQYISHYQNGFHTHITTCNRTLHLHKLRPHIASHPLVYTLLPKTSAITKVLSTETILVVFI